MQIHVHNYLYAQREAFSSAEVSRLRGSFTYPNPLFNKNVQLGYSTFGIQPEISLLEEDDGYIRLPRGVAPALHRLLPKIEIIDETITREVALEKSSIKLYPFQEKAVEALLRKYQGVLSAPTGSGKTIMGIELCIRRSQRSLILCHTKDLLAQWKNRFRTLAGLDPGVIDAKRFEVRDITIGMVQSLRGRPLAPSFVNQFGMVILDEAHHAPAYSFQNLLNQFPARFRYGLTATPERTDGLSFLLHAVIGPVLYQVGKDELFDTGHIIRPIIKVIETNHYNPDCGTYHDLLEGITPDRERNSLIIRHLVREARAGHCCLVLSERVRHVEELNRLFRERCPEVPSGSIVGRDCADHRESLIAQVNAGSVRVLFATRLADEGLDIKRLDRLFITCPIRSHNKVTQQIGRILRPFSGKNDAIVYDFRDLLTGLAESQWKTRKYLAYKSYKVEEVPYENPDN